MSKKILIIGAVAGGASTAARLRRLDESAEIVLIEKGPYPSFSNCCLPYFLGGEIEDSKALLLMSPEKFKKQYNIEVRVENEALEINAEEKKVKIKDLKKNKEYFESYDKLVLATGADAILPRSIKGIEGENVFPVKTVPNVEKIDQFIREKNVKDALVIGGGFIGLEVMENLKNRGLNVSLVEGQKQVMMPLDYEMAQILQKYILDENINLIVNDQVKEIREDKVILQSGRQVKAQLVIAALGVKPNTKLAEGCGIELTERGSIKVNHNYQTSKEDIYALGDVIENHNFITGKNERLALAGPAQRQARAVADHIYNRNHNNKGVVRASAVKIFDLNVASVGLNERECLENKINYKYSFVIPSDRVGLMKKASPIFFKLIFEYPSGKILGAQAISKGMAVKRIDVISTLIQKNGSLEDLKELELCYAPPYGSAKDVVNQAALVGLNLLYEEFKQVPLTKVRELVENHECIIDVREKVEFEASHLIGAKNIPLSELRGRLEEIPKDKKVYLHCRSSQRSYNALKCLQGHGYKEVYNIAGSFLGISLYEYYQDKVLGREKILTDYNFN